MSARSESEEYGYPHDDVGEFQYVTKKRKKNKKSNPSSPDKEQEKRSKTMCNKKMVSLTSVSSPNTNTQIEGQVNPVNSPHSSVPTTPNVEASSEPSFAFNDQNVTPSVSVVAYVPPMPHLLLWPLLP